MQRTCSHNFIWVVLVCATAFHFHSATAFTIDDSTTTRAMIFATRAGLQTSARVRSRASTCLYASSCTSLSVTPRQGIVRGFHTTCINIMASLSTARKELNRAHHHDDPAATAVGYLDNILSRTQVHAMKKDELIHNLDLVGARTDGTRKDLASRLLFFAPYKINNSPSSGTKAAQKQATAADAGADSTDSKKEPGRVKHPGQSYTLRTKGFSKKGSDGVGVGIVLFETDKQEMSWTASKFLPGYRNKYEAEYTGLLMGLRYAKRRGVTNVKVEIDHDVVTGQVKGTYEVSKPSLVPMYEEIRLVADSLDDCEVSLITKKMNSAATDLATTALASQTSTRIKDAADPMKLASTQKMQVQMEIPSATAAHDWTDDDVGVNDSSMDDATDAIMDDDSIFEIFERLETKTEQQAVNDDETTLEVSPSVASTETPASIAASTITAVPSNSNAEIQAMAVIDPSKEYLLMFDGGARGNPVGKAGAGAVIYDDNGEEVFSAWKFLGMNKSNNVAEYEALLLGLECANALGIQRLAAKGDSELIVKQIKGVYRAKNEKLKACLGLTKKATKAFTDFKVSHVFRADNKRADELANHAMDEGESYGYNNA